MVNESKSAYLSSSQRTSNRRSDRKGARCATISGSRYSVERNAERVRGTRVSVVEHADDDPSGFAGSDGENVTTEQAVSITRKDGTGALVDQDDLQLVRAGGERGS